MNRYKLLLVSLLVLFSIPVSVRAENIVSGTVEDEQSSENKKNYLGEAKRTYPVSLNERERSRLESRCGVALARLSNIADKLDSKSPDMTKKYELIEKHVSAIQKRLTNQGLDTAVIDAFLSSFITLIDDYKAKLEAYKLSLNYLTETDCKADPEAFRSLLEDARTKRREFASAVGALNSLIQKDLRSSLEEIKNKLDKNE